MPAVEEGDVFLDLLHQAFSNDQTHHTLVNQIYHKSLISEEEKKAQLSSVQPPKEKASSLLKVMGVEEKPHLLTELFTAVMEVEELQPLAEEMSVQLNKTKQGIFCLLRLTSDFEYTVPRVHNE